MCQEILCQHDVGDPSPSFQSSNGPNRRAFLRTTGLAGAGLAGDGPGRCDRVPGGRGHGRTAGRFVRRRHLEPRS